MFRRKEENTSLTLAWNASIALPMNLRSINPHKFINSPRSLTGLNNISEKSSFNRRFTVCV